MLRKALYLIAALAVCSCAGVPPEQPPAVRPRPAWVNSVDAVYDRGVYAAAVGYAADRALAEKNALANLAAFFGQSVRADQTVSDSYLEAVRNGVTAGWSESSVIQNTIQTSTSMDTLIGAEIGEVWFDGAGVWYAAAIMDKAKTARLYGDMIRANQTMIANLIAVPAAEKNSLEGFSRYSFAATAADMNIAYGNVLKAIGAAPPGELKRGDEYRLQAANIAKAIPVGITVKGDRAGRIQGAFAKALAGMGFRSGGVNSRYVVEAALNLSQAAFPAQEHTFVRYEVNANLLDSDGGNAVLLPYTIDGREGHSTLAEAQNRAIAAVEKRIGEEYAALLSEYLSWPGAKQ